MQNTVKEISLKPAEVAAKVRAELKALYPNTKFSVTSSVRDWSVRVSYADGPTSADVRAIAEQYGQQGFDGRDDSTIYIKGKETTTADGSPAVYAFIGWVVVQRGAY